ncbi:MAG TPA: FprA family A-type flavoprotein [Candidatus Bathyarchaeota archaeon]|nr:FprA family A-type flavoprotein [Candidatus Bathyarchaeota archaeon]
MKIAVIYDSKTGNTEKMAKAIAEGAKTVAEVEVKKIGEAFPLTMLAEVDGVMFGSPVYYADISNDMKDFLAHIESYVKANKKKINGIPAAIFGSYGYDGAWLMEEKLKDDVEGLGYKTYDKVLVMIDSDIKYHFEDEAAKCREFGKKFAESI